MNNGQTPAGADGPSAARSHVEDLVKSGKKPYRLFAFIEAAPGIPDAERDALFAPAAAVAQVLMEEELNLGDELCRAAGALLAARPESRLFLFGAWSATVQAAQPNRSAARSACVQFPNWVAGWPADADRAFYDLLAVVVGGHRKDFHGAVEVLRQRVPAAPPQDGLAEALVYLRELVRYVPAATVRAVLEVGLDPAGPAVPALLRRIVAMCPPDALEQDDDASTLAASVAEGAAKAPTELRAAFLDLCEIIAPSSRSSASRVADILPGRIEKIEGEDRKRYVDSFSRLMRDVGIGAVGFSLGPLAALHQRGRAEAAAAFVDAACLVGRRYGPRAAMEFIEHKTPAAAAAWRQASRG